MKSRRKKTIYSALLESVVFGNWLEITKTLSISSISSTVSYSVVYGTDKQIGKLI